MPLRRVPDTLEKDKGNMNTRTRNDRDENIVDNTMTPLHGKNDSYQSGPLATEIDESCQSKIRALSTMLIAIEQNQPECVLITSYDCNTREGAMRREKHECDVTDNGNDYVNIVLDIVAFTLGRTDMADSAGQFSAVPILTLECTDGKLLSLFSPSVLRCFISRLRTHFLDGQLDEKHPIKLKLVRRSTSNERSMYWLERP